MVRHFPSMAKAMGSTPLQHTLIHAHTATEQNIERKEGFVSLPFWRYKVMEPHLLRSF